VVNKLCKQVCSHSTQHYAEPEMFLHHLVPQAAAVWGSTTSRCTSFCRPSCQLLCEYGLEHVSVLQPSGCFS
jgi:hypothetical protein